MTASNAHGVKTANTTTRATDAQRFGVAVVGLRQCVAAVWKACSSILDTEAMVVTACRASSVVKSEDRTTTNLMENVAEGSNKHVHGR
jgi:hypothetical protein